MGCYWGSCDEFGTFLILTSVPDLVLLAEIRSSSQELHR